MIAVKEDRKTNRIVVPGELVAVIEEYFPGSNTVEIDGNIKSLILGRVEIDLDKRVIHVKPIFPVKPLIPRPGDTVYVRVNTIRDGIVAAGDIIEIEGKGLLSRPFTGILHVTNVSTSYVKDLNDVLRPGDIIRAKIIGFGGPPYHLSIKGRDYGVILARCNFCLGILRLRNQQLYCPSCKVTPKRKTSSYYYFKAAH